MGRRRSDDAPMSFFSFQDIISCTTGIMVMITLLLTLELLIRAVTENPGPLPTAVREALANAVARRAQLEAEVEEGRKTLDRLTRGGRITPADLDSIRSALKDLDRQIGEVKEATARYDGERKSTNDTSDATRVTVASVTKTNDDKTKELERRKKEADVPDFGQSGGKQPLFVECSANDCVVATVPRTGPSRGVAQIVQRFTGADWDRKALNWIPSYRDHNAEYVVLLMRPTAADKWYLLWQTLRNSQFEVGWHVWPDSRALVKQP